MAALLGAPHDSNLISRRIRALAAADRSARAEPNSERSAARTCPTRLLRDRGCSSRTQRALRWSIQELRRRGAPPLVVPQPSGSAERAPRLRTGPRAASADAPRAARGTEAPALAVPRIPPQL